MIVDEDGGDLDKIADRIVFGAFYQRWKKKYPFFKIWKKTIPETKKNFYLKQKKFFTWKKFLPEKKFFLKKKNLADNPVFQYNEFIFMKKFMRLSKQN